MWFLNGLIVKQMLHMRVPALGMLMKIMLLGAGGSFGTTLDSFETSDLLLEIGKIASW